MDDFRSDTVTRPSKAMLEAMFTAEVGDDVFQDDPTVNELEREVAELLGFEAALFTPTGTMANQIAIALHTRPGDSIIAEENAHCCVLEVGAAAALSGVQFDLLPESEGFSDAAIDKAVRPDGPYAPSTALVVVENTHNMCGGRVFDVASMWRIAARAKHHGLKIHCDGARLWNAAQALQVEERDLVRGYDTAAVCFSKGLGAPAGSALLGPAALMTRARKFRKRFGGGMRQIGFFAAAASYALKHNRERLVKDHRNAERFAKHLKDSRARGREVEVIYPDPGTNMVYFKLGKSPVSKQVAALKEAHVLTAGVGEYVRAVFHLDVSDAALQRAMDAVTKVIESLG